MRDGYYHTGDVAARDADGYLTFVGRADDVFKASDYRISPFELESVLIEHRGRGRGGGRAEPRPVRLAVPKAFVTLAAGLRADAASWRATIFALLRASSSRRTSASGGIEFARTAEDDLRQDPARGAAPARGGAPRRGTRARRTSSSKRTFRS